MERVLFRGKRCGATSCIRAAPLSSSGSTAIRPGCPPPRRWGPRGGASPLDPDAATPSLANLVRAAVSPTEAAHLPTRPNPPNPPTHIVQCVRHVYIRVWNKHESCWISRVVHLLSWTQRGRSPSRGITPYRDHFVEDSSSKWLLRLLLPNGDSFECMQYLSFNLKPSKSVLFRNWKI